MSLTDAYNNETAGGKWRGIMSWNPRRQVDFSTPAPRAPTTNAVMVTASTGDSAYFYENYFRVVIEAEHASKFIPGANAAWRTVRGLGYNGEAVSVFPTTVATRTDAAQIRSGSPCLKYSVRINTAGEWTTTLRALPTFSVEAGKPQRVAIAWDDASPEILSFPVSR